METTPARAPWRVSPTNPRQAALSLVQSIGRDLIRDALGDEWRTIVDDYGDVWAVARA